LFEQRFAVLEVSTAQREWESRNARSGDVLAHAIHCNSQTLALLLGYIRSVAKTGLPPAAEARCHLIDLVIFGHSSECPLLAQSGHASRAQ
jgi:hypothetical protein